MIKMEVQNRNKSNTDTIHVSADRVCDVNKDDKHCENKSVQDTDTPDEGIAGQATCSLPEDPRPVKIPMEHNEEDTTGEDSLHSYDLDLGWEDNSSVSNDDWRFSGGSMTESGFGSSLTTNCRKCQVADGMFLCPESRSFWYRTYSTNCCKRVWKDFINRFNTDFPDESALKKKRVYNMTKSLLIANHQGHFNRKVESHSKQGNAHDFSDLSEVTVESFLRFIRFFGPFRCEENRCVAVERVEQLVEHSTEICRKRRIKICWFGGYLNRTEAEEKLTGNHAGTFLIRMSATEETDGSFVLSLVMKDSNIEHFQIHGHPEEAVSAHPFSSELEFRGQHFSSLPDLVNNYLRFEEIVADPIDPGNAIPCLFICPNLPYNNIINGYK